MHRYFSTVKFSQCVFSGNKGRDRTLWYPWLRLSWKKRRKGKCLCSYAVIMQHNTITQGDVLMGMAVASHYEQDVKNTGTQNIYETQL